MKLKNSLEAYKWPVFHYFLAIKELCSILKMSKYLLSIAEICFCVRALLAYLSKGSDSLTSA